MRWVIKWWQGNFQQWGDEHLESCLIDATPVVGVSAVAKNLAQAKKNEGCVGGGRKF